MNNEGITLEGLEKRTAALEAQIQEPLKLVEILANCKHSKNELKGV